MGLDCFDFVVWTSVDFQVIRINKDPEWLPNISTMTDLYFNVTLISIVVLYVCFDKFINSLQGHTCLQFPSARELADVQVPQKCTKYQYQISKFVILSIKISKPLSTFQSEYQISKFQISEYQVSKFTPSGALVIAKTNITSIIVYSNIPGEIV